MTVPVLEMLTYPPSTGWVIGQPGWHNSSLLWAFLVVAALVFALVAGRAAYWAADGVRRTTGRGRLVRGTVAIGLIALIAGLCVLLTGAQVGWFGTNNERPRTENFEANVAALEHLLEASGHAPEDPDQMDWAAILAGAMASYPVSATSGCLLATASVGGGMEVRLACDGEQVELDDSMIQQPIDPS